MRKLDDQCIAKFEAFSHWTQRNFGITSVTWERLTIVLSIFLLLTQEIPRDTNLFIRSLDYFLVTLTFLRFIITFLRTKSTSSGGVATGNFDRMILARERPMAVLIVCFFLPFRVWRASYWPVFMVFSLYFAACNDLPPGESRLSKLARSISAGARNLVPMPARRPT